MKTKGFVMSVIMLTIMLVNMTINLQACSFNTDCQPGSKCVKSGYDLYGICAGGISPGNSNDRQPVYAPLDVNQTYGDTCSFDVDCGPGSKCLKKGWALYGVCVKRR